MTDKEKAEMTYKTLDFIKSLVDDAYHTVIHSCCTV